MNYHDNTMNMLQQHYFKELDGQRLFFAHHQPPKDRSNGFGLLICDPLLEEKQDSRRALVNFANLAAERGFSVLRFDFRGQGESDGNFGDFKPSQALEDIKFAFDELKARSHLDRTAVLGVRYGCNLLAAVGDSLSPDLMVLWAPIINSAGYAEQLLRANLSGQLVVHRKIVEDRKVLVTRMMDGEAVNIDGYGLNLDTYKFIADDLLDENLRDQKSVTLVVGIANNPDRPDKEWDKFRAKLEASPNSEAIRVKSEPFWKLIPLYAERPKEPFETTLMFLEKHVGQQS